MVVILAIAVIRENLMIRSVREWEGEVGMAQEHHWGPKQSITNFQYSSPRELHCPSYLQAYTQLVCAGMRACTNCLLVGSMPHCLPAHIHRPPPAT